jgi:hypothetical protein
MVKGLSLFDREDVFQKFQVFVDIGHNEYFHKECVCSGRSVSN